MGWPLGLNASSSSLPLPQVGDGFTPAIPTNSKPANATPTDQTDFKQQRPELLGQILEMQRFMSNLAIEQPDHWLNWGIAQLQKKKTSTQLLEKGALSLDELAEKLAIGKIGVLEARKQFRQILKENNLNFEKAVNQEAGVFENLAFGAETVDKLSDQGVQEILEYKFGPEVAFLGSGSYRVLKLILREYLTVKNESDCPADDKAILQKAFERIMQNGTWKPAFQATAQDYLQRKFSRSMPKEVGQVLQSGVLYFGTDLMSQIMRNLLYEKPPFENLDAKSLGLSFVVGLAGGLLGKQLDKTNLSDIHKLLIEAGYDGTSAVLQEIILQISNGVSLKEIFSEKSMKDLFQQLILESTGGRWTMRTNSIKNNQENSITEQNNINTEEPTQVKTTDNRQEIQRVLVYQRANLNRLKDYISQVQDLIQIYEEQGKKISIKEAVDTVLSVEQVQKDIDSDLSEVVKIKPTEAKEAQSELYKMMVQKLEQQIISLKNTIKNTQDIKEKAKLEKQLNLIENNLARMQEVQGIKRSELVVASLDENTLASVDENKQNTIKPEIVFLNEYNDWKIQTREDGNPDLKLVNLLKGQPTERFVRPFSTLEYIKELSNGHKISIWLPANISDWGTISIKGKDGKAQTQRPSEETIKELSKKLLEQIDNSLANIPDSEKCFLKVLAISPFPVNLQRYRGGRICADRTLVENSNIKTNAVVKFFVGSELSLAEGISNNHYLKYWIMPNLIHEIGHIRDYANGNPQNIKNVIKPNDVYKSDSSFEDFRIRRTEYLNYTKQHYIINALRVDMRYRQTIKEGTLLSVRSIMETAIRGSKSLKSQDEIDNFLLSWKKQIVAIIPRNTLSNSSRLAYEQKFEKLREILDNTRLGKTQEDKALEMSQKLINELWEEVDFLGITNYGSTQPGEAIAEAYNYYCRAKSASKNGDNKSLHWLQTLYPVTFNLFEEEFNNTNKTQDLQPPTQSEGISSIHPDLDIQASLGSNTRFIIDQYTQGEINTNHNYEIESKKVVKQAVDLIQAGKSYKEVLDFLAIERRVFAEDDAFGKTRITNGASTPVRIGGERYENYLPLALKLLERVNNRQTLEDFIEQNNINNLGSLVSFLFNNSKYFKKQFPEYDEDSLYEIPLDDSLIKKVLDFVEDEAKNGNYFQMTRKYEFQETVDGQLAELSSIAPVPSADPPTYIQSVLEARIWHTPTKSFPIIEKKLDSLHNEILQTTDKKQTINKLAEFYWWMSQACFFERGSAAISDLYLDALAKTKGINIVGWKDGIDPNLEAILSPKEEFIKNFTNLGQIESIVLNELTQQIQEIPFTSTSTQAYIKTFEEALSVGLSITDKQTELYYNAINTLNFDDGKDLLPKHLTAEEIRIIQSQINKQSLIEGIQANLGFDRRIKEIIANHIFNDPSQLVNLTPSQNIADTSSHFLEVVKSLEYYIQNTEQILGTLGYSDILNKLNIKAFERFNTIFMHTHTRNRDEAIHKEISKIIKEDVFTLQVVLEALKKRDLSTALNTLVFWLDSEDIQVPNQEINSINTTTQNLSNNPEAGYFILSGLKPKVPPLMEAVLKLSMLGENPKREYFPNFPTFKNWLGLSSKQVSNNNNTPKTQTENPTETTQNNTQEETVSNAQTQEEPQINPNSSEIIQLPNSSGDTQNTPKIAKPNIGSDDFIRSLEKQNPQKAKYLEYILNKHPELKESLNNTEVQKNLDEVELHEGTTSDDITYNLKLIQSILPTALEIKLNETLEKELVREVNNINQQDIKEIKNFLQLIKINNPATYDVLLFVLNNNKAIIYKLTETEVQKNLDELDLSSSNEDEVLLQNLNSIKKILGLEINNINTPASSNWVDFEDTWNFADEPLVQALGLENTDLDPVIRKIQLNYKNLPETVQKKLNNPDRSEVTTELIAQALREKTINPNITVHTLEELIDEANKLESNIKKAETIREFGGLIKYLNNPNIQIARLKDSTIEEFVNSLERLKFNIDHPIQIPNSDFFMGFDNVVDLNELKQLLGFQSRSDLNITIDSIASQLKDIFRIKEGRFVEKRSLFDIPDHIKEMKEYSLVQMTGTDNYSSVFRLLDGKGLLEKLIYVSVMQHYVWNGDDCSKTKFDTSLKNTIDPVFGGNLYEELQERGVDLNLLYETARKGIHAAEDELINQLKKAIDIDSRYSLNSDFSDEEVRIYQQLNREIAELNLEIEMAIEDLGKIQSEEKFENAFSKKNTELRGKFNTLIEKYTHTLRELRSKENAKVITLTPNHKIIYDRYRDYTYARANYAGLTTEEKLTAQQLDYEVMARLDMIIRQQIPEKFSDAYSQIRRYSTNVSNASSSDSLWFNFDKLPKLDKKVIIDCIKTARAIMFDNLSTEEKIERQSEFQDEIKEEVDLLYWADENKNLNNFLPILLDVFYYRIISKNDKEYNKQKFIPVDRTEEVTKFRATIENRVRENGKMVDFAINFMYEKYNQLAQFNPPTDGQHKLLIAVDNFLKKVDTNRIHDRYDIDNLENYTNIDFSEFNEHIYDNEFTNNAKKLFIEIKNLLGIDLENTYKTKTNLNKLLELKSSLDSSLEHTKLILKLQINFEGVDISQIQKELSRLLIQIDIIAKAPNTETIVDDTDKLISEINNCLLDFNKIVKNKSLKISFDNTLEQLIIEKKSIIEQLKEAHPDKHLNLSEEGQDDLLERTKQLIDELSKIKDRINEFKKLESLLD